MKDFTVRYGDQYIPITVKAVDPDGEVLVFSTADLPAYATVAILRMGCTISHLLQPRDRGALNMTVFVQDGNGGKDTSTFN